MKPLYTILTFLFIFISARAGHCPVVFIKLDGYIGIEEGFVTKEELREFDINNIRDSLGSPHRGELIVSDFMIQYRRIGDTAKSRYYYFGSNTDFRKVVDTILNKLNLQDTLFTQFTLYQDTKSEDDWFRSYFDFESSQTYIISSDEVVQLKRNPDATYMVYPSPASDHVSVRFDFRSLKSGEIRMFDALGKEVSSYRSMDLSKAHTFDISELGSGSYYIHTTLDGENFVKKIVKP